MKRNIVFNEKRTAIVISDNLTDAVNLIHKDTEEGNDIFAFDTSLHIAYAYRVVKNGYTIIEEQVPIMQFRNFKIIGNVHDIYLSIIKSFMLNHY